MTVEIKKACHINKEWAIPGMPPFELDVNNINHLFLLGAGFLAPVGEANDA